MTVSKLSTDKLEAVLHAGQRKARGATPAAHSPSCSRLPTHPFSHLLSQCYGWKCSETPHSVQYTTGRDGNGLTRVKWAFKTRMLFLFVILRKSPSWNFSWQIVVYLIECTIKFEELSCVEDRQKEGSFAYRTACLRFFRIHMFMRMKLRKRGKRARDRKR